MKNELMAIIGALLGSSVVTAVVSALAGRSTQAANAASIRATEATQVAKAALEIEERANSRYQSVLDALTQAQAALAAAERELLIQEDYIRELVSILVTCPQGHIIPVMRVREENNV